MSKNEDIAELFDALKIVSSEANQIESLSLAFERIGNESVADELRETAEKLRRAAASARGAFGSYQNGLLRQSEDSVGRTLAALLHQGDDT